MRPELVDLFLTYRSNARLAQAERPALGLSDQPGDPAVSADFALCPLAPMANDKEALAGLLLSDRFRHHLVGFGFDMHY